MDNLPESQVVDVIIRTYNSGETIDGCLNSVTRNVPSRKIFVIDHESTDRTVEIANKYGAFVVSENSGLGFATREGIRLSGTEYILFVDSDVTVVRRDFISEAVRLIKLPRTAAVVGNAVGHIFSYGLPLGLTLMSRNFASEIFIPDGVSGRETYYFQKHLRERSLKTRYVPDSMVHNSIFRAYRYWPEWQGAQTRLATGFNFREVAYSMLVIFLMLSNSRSLRNFCYYPIFVAKFLVGYLNPMRWRNMDRGDISIQSSGRE